MEKQNKSEQGEGKAQGLPQEADILTSEARSCGKTRVRGFGSLRRLCFAAILAAMSLVLGKFLQIPHPFQEFIRISFENLPVLLAGISMGPIVGALVGTVADLLGCVLYGYSINPIVTLGAASVGLVSGFLARYVVKKSLLAKVAVSVSLAHLVGSVLIKSAGLAAWYLAKYEFGYLEFLGWRFLNYVIVGVAECLVLYLLLRNRAFAKQIKEMCKI
ncbi:MAG: folate family ECF transporter S component [Clostridia bacterium]|nr:folate family ECF transporter S component [Clostridia bacterium]